MKTWPKVVGEFETIEKIKKGFSIARVGDGEYGVLDGKGYTRQRKPNKNLTAELRSLMERPHKHCLIGIPTMDRHGDKYNNWKRHKARYIQRLKPGITYYSAFISRPDCGRVWMENQKYADLVRSMWHGKSIAIVCEPTSKLLTDMNENHESISHIVCPMYDAYFHIDDYENRILELKPDIAVLSVGVTATALAHRICKRGIQAVDIGSIGAFLRRWPCVTS